MAVQSWLKHQLLLQIKNNDDYTMEYSTCDASTTAALGDDFKVVIRQS